MFEHLEARRLMSVSLRGGVLRVYGTARDDAIVIERSDAQPHKLQVTVNDELPRLFRAGKVHGILVRGYEGDDVIELSEDVLNRAVIFGGAGDDEIVGGSGKDLIFGGDGEDDVAGGPNRDKVFSGDGEDVFNSTDARREMKDRVEGEDGIRVTIDQVSPAVRAAVLELLDGNDFENLLEEVDDGAVVYELEWDAPGPHSAKINLAGEVIELEVEIDPDTLPSAVKTAIATRYPDGEITEAETLELPDTPLRYEVEVAIESEGVRRELVITPAGEILTDEIEGPIED
jgi:hypothetical protein